MFGEKATEMLNAELKSLEIKLWLMKQLPFILKETFPRKYSLILIQQMSKIQMKVLEAKTDEP